MRSRTTSVKGLENVLFEVWLVSRATTALLDERLAATPLNADEFAIYSVLSSKDAMTPSELAQWMSAPATTVSSYVKRFEQRGHVEREPHPDDRRSYRIRLTTAGRAAHAEAATAFLPALREVSRELGTREATVARALRTLRSALDGVADRD
jgi:DNA-binding MarR family transcriptional regulator